MAKNIEIKICTECPHHTSERDYTADSFEMVSRWKCKHKDGPDGFVRRYVDWNDKATEFIPDDCPL